MKFVKSAFRVSSPSGLNDCVTVLDVFGDLGMCRVNIFFRDSSGGNSQLHVKSLRANLVEYFL